MAFGIESSSGAANDALGGNISTAFTVTSANLLMVGVTLGEAGHDATAIPPAWNGVAMTLVTGSNVSDGNFCAVAWFKMANPAAGTFNVTLAGSGVSQGAVHIISFIDADSAVSNTPSTNTATSATPNVTVADSANGEIVLAVTCTDGSGGAGSTAVTTSGGVEIFEAEDLANDTDHSSQRVTATTSGTAMTWSAVSDPWAASGVAVSAGGGGPPSPVLGRRLMVMP